MLTIILGILSSGGFGSILGLLGGLINRKLDLQAKEQDHKHELEMMEAQQKAITAEYEQRTKIATIEAEAQAGKDAATVAAAEATADGSVEVAGYGAMIKSYDFAATTPQDGWVDKASKALRPLITVFFMFLSFYILYKLNVMVEEQKTAVDPDSLVLMWKTTIEWILFQAGVAIGWWFAMRPGKMPSFNK